MQPVYSYELQNRDVIRSLSEVSALLEYLVIFDTISYLDIFNLDSILSTSFVAVRREIDKVTGSEFYRDDDF